MDSSINQFIKIASKVENNYTFDSVGTALNLNYIKARYQKTLTDTNLYYILQLKAALNLTKKNLDLFYIKIKIPDNIFKYLRIDLPGHFHPFLLNFLHTHTNSIGYLPLKNWF